MLLHFSGCMVHVARAARHLPKKDFNAPASRTLQRIIIKLCDKTDTEVEYVLFVAAAAV